MAILGKAISVSGGVVCYLMGLSHCQDVARPGQVASPGATVEGTVVEIPIVFLGFHIHPRRLA